MKTKMLSPQLLRKRKLLIVLPLLVLPFVTLLFWALGGGKASDVQAQKQNSKQGLNMELPDANLKDDKSLDKLSYYEKAALDSAKLEELMKNDPYYLQRTGAERSNLFINDSIPSSIKYQPDRSYASSNLNASPYSGHNYQDANEAKVYNKLNELKFRELLLLALIFQFESENPPTVQPLNIDHLILFLGYEYVDPIDAKLTLADY